MPRYRILHPSLRLMVPLLLLNSWVFSDSNANVEQHLQLAKQLLVSGQYNEALSQYTAAIDLDPSNYLHYFRRATVYLSMSRPLPALNDLSKSVELNPNFIGAYLKRGMLRLSFGQFDEARSDLNKAHSIDSSNHEATETLEKVNAIESAVNAAREAMASGSYDAAIAHLERPVEDAVWAWELRDLRAECYQRRGDLESTVRDLRHMVRAMSSLGGSNSESRLFSTYTRIASVVYESGDIDLSLRDVRECLKLDPEHSQCKALHRAIKKTSKGMTTLQESSNGKRWAECSAAAKELLADSKVPQFFSDKARSMLCKCLAKQASSDSKTSTEAITVCTKVIDEGGRSESAAEALCDRAEIYESQDKLDEAMSDFGKAREIDGNLQRAREGRERIEKVKKQRGKRDYYAILGVSRTASTREIERAYRKLAAKWHPDRFRKEGITEEERKVAERKFMDIASAKEVLSDDEKRKQYDEGVDPLDPEAQAHGHGGPFPGGGFPFPFGGPGGFNPFGNGGFQFKFHFG